MSKVSKRGFDEADTRWFSEKSLITLRKAHKEIKWLIDREYKIENVVTFVGDRYQFSTRQRDALKRSTCTTKNQIIRKEKELSINEMSNGIIQIDTFNLIITLEVALSGGTLITGNDGNIRDLAGLRGTYKLIDKTDIALELIGELLKDKEAKEVRFYLDSPVSNSGKLKSKILEYSKQWGFETEVELVNNADIVLENLERVVSSDSIVIDKCKSYFNMGKSIIEDYINEANIVNLSN
ncbi:DUF434 domain-containing protein [Clostridium uliginosum]|uniref:DUF434 domain-containing protein n=1 Tax=Clostridium uliginosum TaxID=119641 RepID=A0A1I1GP16_9CLOT|nr:DUF434 domain-containing protein [Clostridium uliginosum]SFC13195.1 hypothetical protein SAMN05421842_1017 [Clostridium uliginosum]